MTKVSYEVRKEGFKGCITVNTFDEAVEKAKQIGGTYKAVYSEVETAPMTERDLRLRAKRMAHFGIAQAIPWAGQKNFKKSIDIYPMLCYTLIMKER